MGAGFTIACTFCDYEFDLYNDYGGTYDWETYHCLDCDNYFNVRTWNNSLVIWKEIAKKGIINKLRKKTQIIQLIRPWNELECEYCKSKTVKRVYDNEIVDLENFNVDEFARVLIVCPKCKAKMQASVIDFDD